MALQDVSTATTSVRVDSANRRLVVERIFDAPRDLVWKAFTEADRLARWWGPRGWDNTTCKLEPRPEGVWHYCMRGPDGAESWGKAIYREVAPPLRIVYYDVFSDAEGNTVEGMPGAVITVTFTEENGGTKVTSVSEYATAEEVEKIIGMGAVQGISETFDRLAEFLAAGSGA